MNTKSKLTFSALGAAALLLTQTPLNAAQINGGISFAGDYRPVDAGGNTVADLTLADKIYFGPGTAPDGSTIESTFVYQRNGDFSSVAVGSLATIASPLDISPAVVPSGAVWSVGGFSLTLSFIQQDYVLPNSLQIEGLGTITGNGFDATEGTWIATFNTIAQTYSWSFSSGAMPCTGQIGDFVWNDGDHNGCQDAGEPGLVGVQVDLYSGCGPNATLVTSTNTDANGHYLFTGLCAGTYSVGFHTPSGYIHTLSHQSCTVGGLPSDQTDSNCECTGSDDCMVCVTLATDNSQDLTIDCGYIPNPPTCSMSPDAVICSGGSATFTDSPSGGTGPFTVSWTGPNSYTATGPSITINNAQPTDAGAYVATATDSKGQKVTCSANLVVNSSPKASVNSGATCAGTPIMIKATVTGGTGPFHYLWTVPAAAAAPGDTASFNTSVAGSYSVVVSDATSCHGSGSGVLIVNTNPTVTVNSGVTCSGTPALIMATVSGSGPFHYAWTVPSGASNPGDVASFNATVGGPYSVIVTDNNGCHGGGSGGLIVNTNPVVTVNSGVTCAGTPALIAASVTGTGPFHYVWTVPAGASNPGDVASFNATVGGTYSVIVTDKNGCHGGGSGGLLVNANPQVWVNSAQTCLNSNVTITASVTGAGGYHYLWTVPSGAVNPGDVASFTAKVAGTYTVQVTDRNGCHGSGSGVVTSGPCGFCTWTPGGWGAPPNGSNVAALLYKLFPTVYPSGVTVGGTYTLKFTTPQAITVFLPSGTTPGVLKKSYLNPAANTEAGEFASQVLALQLNVDASIKGFSKPGLANLKVAPGLPLAGYTVSQVLTLANKVLGGATSALPAGVSVSTLNNLLSSLNGNFDNCAGSGGYMVF